MTPAEIIQKYGSTPLTFKSYYKYTFVFEGVAEDGNVVSAQVGGIADEIYKQHFGEIETINGIDPDIVVIRNKDGVAIESY